MGSLFINSSQLKAGLWKGTNHGEMKSLTSFQWRYIKDGYLFHKYILRANYLSGTVLCLGDTAVEKESKTLSPVELIFYLWGRKPDNKQSHIKRNNLWWTCWEEKSNETSTKHVFFVFKLPIYPVYVHRFEKQIKCICYGDTALINTRTG